MSFIAVPIHVKQRAKTDSTVRASWSPGPDHLRYFRLDRPGRFATHQLCCVQRHTCWDYTILVADMTPDPMGSDMICNLPGQAVVSLGAQNLEGQTTHVEQDIP